MSRRAFDIFFISIAIAVGLGVWGWTAFNLNIGKALQNWQMAPGEIVAIRSHRTDQSAIEGRKTYKIGVDYRYVVACQTHNGTQYDLPSYAPQQAYELKLQNGPNLPTDVQYVEREAEKMRQAFPVGRKLDIFYDPADPQISAIDIPSGNSVWIPAELYVLALVLVLYTRPPKPARLQYGMSQG